MKFSTSLIFLCLIFFFFELNGMKQPTRAEFQGKGIRTGGAMKHKWRQESDGENGGHDEWDGDDDGEENSSPPNKTLSSFPLFNILANIANSVLYGGENKTKPLNVTHTIRHVSLAFWKPILGLSRRLPVLEK